MNYPAASLPQAGKQRGIEQQTDDRPKGRGTCPSGRRVKPLPASGGIKICALMNDHSCTTFFVRCVLFLS